MWMILIISIHPVFHGQRSKNSFTGFNILIKHATYNFISGLIKQISSETHSYLEKSQNVYGGNKQMKMI